MIQEYIDKGLAKINWSERHPGLGVLKYKNKVFFDNLWDENLVWMRGAVVDSNLNVVSQPFKKIFNYLENGNGMDVTDNEMGTVVEKINGFMANVFVYQNEVLVSTTGSLDSDYADMARSMIFDEDIAEFDVVQLMQAFDISNLMFEICHPHDPHIIREKAGAYILAYRESYGQELHTSVSLPFAGMWNVPKCEHKNVRLAITEAMNSDGEGSIIYRKDGHEAIKVKSKQYLAKKFLARKTPERLGVILKNGTWKEIIDDDFHAVIELMESREGFIDRFIAADEQARIDIMDMVYSGLKGGYRNGTLDYVRPTLRT